MKGWGYEDAELETMTNGISSNPRAMQEFMMSFELKLAPVEKDEARRSFAVVLPRPSSLDNTADPVFLCNYDNNSFRLNRVSDREWSIAVYHR